ncbi:MAG: hypothetical protein ACP6IS_08410 [Candidatus Asgardarchaeia archaeon]
MYTFGGDAESIVKYLPTGASMVIQVYNEKLIKHILDHLKPFDTNIKVTTYLDMQVDEQSFRPHNPEKAIKITNNYLREFIDLKRTQGKILDDRVAKNLISNWKYYGLFVDNKLV